MAFVRKPDRFSSCVIVPGRVSDPHGFVTDHRELDGINGPIKVYFSVTGLRQIADKHPQVGLVRVEKLDDARAEAERLAEELEAAQDRITELEAAHDRIAGFVKDGFKVQKVMGRPKKEANA